MNAAKPKTLSTIPAFQVLAISSADVAKAF